MRLPRERHRVTQTLSWEVRLSEERPWEQNGKEGFLVEVGPQRSLGASRDEEGMEEGQSEGRLEWVAGSWCTETVCSHWNHVCFFAGHFARCSEVLVCLHPVLTWLWSR